MEDVVLLKFLVTYPCQAQADDKTEATIEMELEADKTLRVLVPEVLAALRETEGVPEPAVLDIGQPSGELSTYTVSFGGDVAVGPADWDTNLGVLKPDGGTMRIDYGAAIVGRG